MSEYYFDEMLFKKNFSVKDDKSVDSYRLKQEPDKCFKLFPYKATAKKSSPIVYEMEECVSGFFRKALEISAEPVEYEELCKKIQNNIEIEEDDIELFKDIIRSLFFKNGNFYGYNIGLYPYQTVDDNKSSEGIAEFLYCVLGLDDSDKENIVAAIKSYPFNALEKMVVNLIEIQNINPKEKNEKYYKIIRSIQKQFKADFAFMLSSGMTSVEDLANVLSFYYFYYVSQTCITLGKFGSGEHEQLTPLYFALDWEKVSKNRKCCENGWTNLQNNVSQMFSHAITLKIINQKNSSEMMDYIDFKSLAESSKENDRKISNEIKRAEATYISYVGDCTKIKNIPEEVGANLTDGAIRHLFKCVNTQFTDTDRKRASQLYSEKFSEFCKARFVKNRKKSGLTLNLTESDIIFLTKLAIQRDEKIRLNDLYQKYENRGVYLDSTSKSLLQDFFTKLNLIEKKSDSGDAQYVKRIL